MVHAHNRVGNIRVHQHYRGHGYRTNDLEPFRKAPQYLSDTPIGVRGFTINFTTDPEKYNESVTVIGDDYEDVVDRAFDLRKNKRYPVIAMEVIDPSLFGAIKGILGGAGAKLGQVGSATKSLIKEKATLGNVGKAAKWSLSSERGYRKFFSGQAKEFQNLVKTRYLTNAKVQFLIRDAFDKDPVKRNAAGVSLKRNYPDIYYATDFAVTPYERAQGLPQRHV